jgi:hypothetical protein
MDCFERAPDTQRELQLVPECIKENDFQSAYEAWEKRQDEGHCSQGD